MLTGLSIRDIVLIDRLDLAFPIGLSVLTGETGAGKSILLDALGLALGARADSALVRTGSTGAAVAASFDVPSAHPARAILADGGIEAEDNTLILRRTLAADGGSRAFVNDQPTTVALLRALGDALVEVQGQSEQRGLVDPATHRALLDAYGGLAKPAAAVAEAWRAWQDAAAAERAAAADYEKARADEDYLRHAVAELDELDPQAGEEDGLAQRRGTLVNREKLIDGLNAALDEIGGERDIEGRLQAALAAVERVAPLAGGALDAGREALERAIAEASEAGVALTTAGHDLDLDQGRLEEIEERLFRLRDVARKHGTEVAALPALRDDMARRVAVLEDQGDARARLAAATAKARRGYEAAAAKLHKARVKSAAALDKAIAGELPPLRLDKAVFVTDVAPRDEADWGPNGSDSVRFLIATVPGAAPGPLAKVASGGELSRLMLALRVVLSGAGRAASLVFDEVDSGVGGATAAAVGERLARLSEQFQVLVVTHSPQVAARGGHHLRVDKVAAAGELRTRVAELAVAERGEEIARMLSGRKVTAAARAAAKSLLKGDAA